MQTYAPSMGSTHPAYVYAQHPSSTRMYVPAQQVYDYEYSIPQPPNGYIVNGNGAPVVPPPPLAQRSSRSRKHYNEISPSSSSDPSKKPLKSAMKKPSPSGSVAGASTQGGHSTNSHLHRSRTVPAQESAEAYRERTSRSTEMKPTTSNMSRGRSLSGSERGARATSLTRPRSRSQSRHNYTPSHLILSFSGSCKVNLSSVMFQETVDRIRERVLPMWPDGVEFQVYRDETSEYLVKFSGNPWTARSSLGVMAMKLILELFAVLARQGYTCASSIDTGGAATSPRLVFNRLTPDPSAEFSMVIFPSGRYKVKLINFPPTICESLTAAIQDAFPRRMRSAVWDESDMYKITMDRHDFDSIADLFIATLLQQCSRYTLRLEGTIPLSHSGFWGFLQGRKELWIFRRQPTPYS